VDAALAILTVHHWTDPRRGLAEMGRIARKRVVIFTWDQDAWESFWLVREYLPCIRDLDRPRALAVAEMLGLDLLSVANEGKLVAIVAAEAAVDERSP
jgi:hypothetical protein